MPKKKRKPARPVYRESGQLLAKAGETNTADPYLTYERTEVPGGDTTSETGKSQAFEKARRLKESNYWLKRFLRVKMSVMNYGITLTPRPEGTEGGGKPGDEDVQAFEDWMDGDIPLPDFEGNTTVGFPNQTPVKMGERVMKFIEDATFEFLLLEGSIAFWMNEQLPVLLPPERCRYKDVLGIETLFYQHGLAAADIAMLPAEQQARFLKAELAIGEEDGEFFKVLKLERTGFGLSWPSLQSMFRTASTMESMEMGESSYAYTGRQHMRQHKLGHPIESGPMCGKPTHFWTKKRGDQVRKVVENKKGFIGDFTTNFDHIVEYPHEDMAYFTDDKWQSPEHRLTIWGGALAQMMIAQGVTPYLSNLLRAEMTFDRAKLAAFLEGVINNGFQPPAPIRITYSDLIFLDSRIWSEMVKFGVTCGAVSQSTFREQAGFNDERERLKKEQEAKDFATDPQVFKPAYDPAHGDPNEQGGKPPGKADADAGNPT